jgi:aryl-alcohol dehydrogenase-like predicted oxidoreductase
VTAAIVGGRSKRQVEETVAALTFRLSEEERTKINAFLAANPA